MSLPRDTLLEGADTPLAPKLVLLGGGDTPKQQKSTAAAFHYGDIYKEV